MSREEHIEYLKKEVCRKFGRTIESASDFDALSRSIYNATSDNVSPSTLKRFFGYVKYDAAPRTSTLSILARYAGYTGWSDLCENHDTDKGRRTVTMPKKKHPKKYLRNTNSFILAAICCILVIICIAFGLRIRNMKIQDDLPHEIIDTVYITETVTDTVYITKAKTDPDEEKYQKIRRNCLMTVKHKTDSVMALRGKIPLYRYVEKCDSAYFDIAFEQMKTIINRQISEAFPGNDTLRTIHSNALFIECRDLTLVLMTHLTTEERQQAFKEKFEAEHGRPYEED